jgi:hypothetical protein
MVEMEHVRLKSELIYDRLGELEVELAAALADEDGHRSAASE